VSTVVDAGTGLTCLTNSVQSTAAYNLTDETKRCVLLFKVN